MDKLDIAVARIEEQLKATRKDIADYHTELKEHVLVDERRLSSLEHSRSRARTVGTVTWGVLVVLGWDKVSSFFTGGP
jgi:hypothetical protein